ncbi:MAG TPA: hypothetical protein VHQ90_06995 [Thermoanaerobaculia bacterium]|nr:hypothetical protein [Thermoanaerobaculia bacterium]
MKKQANGKSKLTLSRESIRMLETGQVVRVVGGASGEDCTAHFTNCHTITIP